jgi:hypothetical protein
MKRGLERALVLIATWTMVAAAAPRSQPVSPGHADRFAGVAGPCPTFSWTWAPGSAGFELAVFVLPEEPDPRSWTAEGLAALEPVLRETLPATTAWTPDIERCLERGGRYAWFVRNLDPFAEDAKEGGSGDWSEARLFRIEPAPGATAERPKRSMDENASAGALARRHPERLDGELPAIRLPAGLAEPSPQRQASSTFTYPGSGGVSASVSSGPGAAFGVRGLVTEAAPPATDLDLGAGVYGEATHSSSFGVFGVHRGSAGIGVLGQSLATSGSGNGVFGLGSGPDGIGVYGGADSSTGIGVRGDGGLAGVYGATPDSEGAGVEGRNFATSGFANGVVGSADSTNGRGVIGLATAGTGFTRGVLGESHSTSGRGVFGDAHASSGDTAGVVGRVVSGQGTGGLFINEAGGDLLRGMVGGDVRLRVVGNGSVFANGSFNCALSSSCFNTGIAGDIAERIDAVEPLAPGEVVEVDPDRPGWFRRSRGARSPRVVGVVSGQPAITLNNSDLGGPLGEVGSDQRPLLALAGKVPVRVSDEGGAIAPGDLLVASSTPGVAMRCERSRRCRGASVGKALEPHRAGEGRILMMVFPN